MGVANSKDFDPTALMHRLLGAFVVRMPQNQGMSRGSSYTCSAQSTLCHRFFVKYIVILFSGMNQ